MSFPRVAGRHLGQYVGEKVQILVEIETYSPEDGNCTGVADGVAVELKLPESAASDLGACTEFLATVTSATTLSVRSVRSCVYMLVSAHVVVLFVSGHDGGTSRIQELVALQAHEVHRMADDTNAAAWNTAVSLAHARGHELFGCKNLDLPPPAGAVEVGAAQ
eukprot:TRINITY_DN1023_c0_g1_i1.p1 TRINITY_DN1023_c0_g1~~TRINITY_DN1023_c0_g1_i1.p1  ORF type:complete len:183 (-),score=19.91 TRINITY_DN1023_c0_g1_i1:51-539(-)